MILLELSGVPTRTYLTAQPLFPLEPLHSAVPPPSYCSWPSTMAGLTRGGRLHLEDVVQRSVGPPD
ncbi:hypothetical protein E2C01_011534 [Portunus trituberculatus]|uniref:Uncharacterized protein n=1 Tax=Portunus trituberculatus TaxID=210409 RepID=A0A5B7DBL6_PORTR|nr:hypothetical protein [Portunus trituberculatus]